MNKKFVFVTLLVLVAAMVLAACAPEPETIIVTEIVEGEPVEVVVTATPDMGEECTAPADDPYACADPTGQRVVFWHQHSGDRETELLKIINDFNATNEYGITVIAEYQGSYGDIFNKMLGVLGTEDVPNLVVAYQNQAATYALTPDALVDMNPLVANADYGLSDDEIADFFPGFYNADVFPTFDNARYGFPPNRSMEVLYYNADWLAELYAAGAIDFEGAPVTPEQFQQAACAATTNPFSAATGDQTTSVGYELSIDASRYASWTFAFGGDVFDYDAGQYDLDSDAAVEAMTFLQGLFNEGCARIVTEAYGDQTDFGAGVTLFTVGSSSGLPFYGSAVEAGSNHAWSIAAIPHTTPDPVMNVYGASVSIPTTNRDAELATWLFVKWYTSPEIQARWAIASQYFPVRYSAADSLTEYFEANPDYALAFEMLEYGTKEPPVPGYDFVREVMEESMAAIADGADVAETLAPLNAEANEILADQE